MFYILPLLCAFLKLLLEEILVKVWFSRSAVPDAAGVRELSVTVKTSPVVPVEVTDNSAFDEPEMVNPVKVPTEVMADWAAWETVVAVIVPVPEVVNDPPVPTIRALALVAPVTPENGIDEAVPEVATQATLLIQTSPEATFWKVYVWSAVGSATESRATAKGSDAG